MNPGIELDPFHKIIKVSEPKDTIVCVNVVLPVFVDQLSHEVWTHHRIGRNQFVDLTKTSPVYEAGKLVAERLVKATMGSEKAHDIQPKTGANQLEMRAVYLQDTFTQGLLGNCYHGHSGA
ncbi:hypothetical protein [Rubripirellula tenax]|uniref:hypothetical protein n=1 Tax=Rubripirellula tenax TaxID=2528015 RepID=UPI0011B6001B|nr:hypothetical protein [Rubripirellula tenax]